MVACMNVTPPAFQVLVINEDWVSPKVTSMIKKMSYELGIRLEKKKNGISKLPYLKGQSNKQGQGYDSTIDKEKKTTFISKGLSKYQDQPEEWECDGIKKSDFEIFADVINSMGKE